MFYLYGASGHAKVIIESLEESEIHDITLIDNDSSKETILSYKVIHQLPEINHEIDQVIISIGNNSIRKKISHLFNERIFATAIDINANISKRTKIGVGTVIMKGVSINSDVQIGTHCILNTNASIDHDCKIDNFVHISPNVGLAGNVTVGEGTHIGIGAAVIQGINIGKWATIGAGAVIIKDVPDYAVVVGNPGKIIKYNKEL